MDNQTAKTNYRQLLEMIHDNLMEEIISDIQYILRPAMSGEQIADEIADELHIAKWRIKDYRERYGSRKIDTICRDLLGWCCPENLVEDFFPTEEEEYRQRREDACESYLAKANEEALKAAATKVLTMPGPRPRQHQLA